MSTFVHIGMPKTLSSALQAEFYPKHEDIYYLGVGVGSLIDYIDDDTNFIFETLLLYAKSGYYQRYSEFARDIVLKHKDVAKKQQKILGVSLEWLSFNFTPDMVDNLEKAKRLSHLLGEEVSILVFCRSQDKLLQSLYSEYIKVGYSEGYDNFVRYLLMYKDRNFFYDLNYDILYKNYSKFFKKENIHFIPIEHYRAENGELIVNDGAIKLIEKFVLF